MNDRNYADNRAYGVDAAKFARVDVSASLAAVNAAIDAIVSGIARAFKAVHMEMQERAAIRMLSELDDRILHDIGVPRPEISTMVRKMMENPDLDHRVIRK